MLDLSVHGISMLGVSLMLVLIVLGSTLQVVTGIGLGLMAGPVLLFFLDSVSAIQVAIILNLLLTFCLLFADRAYVSKRWLWPLSLWALVGIPCGFSLIFLIDQSFLKILAACFILTALIQLNYFPATASTSASSTWRLHFGGYVSSLLAGSLAAPGPVALWTLLVHGVDALTARATIRYYFVVAYGFSLALHISYAGIGGLVVEMLFVLVPAMFVGIAVGMFVRRSVSPDVLMQVLKWLLLAMGLSLLIKGVVDVV